MWEDSYFGDEEILIQPGTRNVTYSYFYEPKESNLEEEGWIPEGAHLTAVSGTVYKIADENDRPIDNIIVDDLLQGDPVVIDNTVYVKLSYPSDSGFGRYKITMVVYFDADSSDETDFKRVIVKNK